MCTNTRLVINKYTRKPVRVSCGKCEACEQEKANKRAARIRNHSMNGEASLFVTLTYSNKFIPYALKSDLQRNDCEIPIFRNYTARRLKIGKFVEYENFGTPIDSFPRLESECDYFPELNKARGCVGVIYYKDVIDFMKRLRQNLKRNYNYEYKVSYTAVGEYGSGSFRPHFHLLIFFRKDFEQALRSAIIESWPFGDLSKSNKRIQLSKDASGYVASYVSKSANLPQIFKERAYKQVHHSSKNFGVRLRCFSLCEILARVERGNLSYSRTVVRNGVSEVVTLPIPKYVISRYFPKPKGYFLFTGNEILQLLRLPWLYKSRLTNGCSIDYEYNGKRIIITPESYGVGTITWDEFDFRSWFVRLNHAYCLYHAETGKNEYDFAFDFERVWCCYIHYNNRLLYHEVTDFSDFYENINEFVDRPQYVPTLSNLHKFQLDANARKDIVETTSNLRQLYYKKLKTKSVVGVALSHYDDEL